MQLPSGYTLIALDKVNSTHDEAATFVKEGAADRTVITAKEQIKGRGRGTRVWTSSEGNLFATLVLFPKRSLTDWPQLSFVISLALADALEKILPRARRVEVKWPNDVLVDDKKISGVLVETCTRTNGEEALLLGFGVNCRMHPETTLYPATDLAAMGAGAEHLTPESVLELTLKAFEPLYQNWQTRALRDLRQAWLKRAKNLGAWIQVRLPDYAEGAAPLTGRFIDIEEETGNLLLEEEGGKIRKIAHGDVFFKSS
jgi:BirA family biotin operon repressor/biotin-[acetyl-CoA-carboxylase] ligase